MYPQSEVKINKIILPPEITWTSLMVHGSDNTYEDVLEKGKYFRYDNKGCFLFFADEDSAHKKYIDGGDFTTESEFRMWISWALQRESFRKGFLQICSNKQKAIPISYMFDKIFYKGE